MKKTLLLAAAALFAASSAMADTWTVVGSDVNGSSWKEQEASNDMTETSSGVYELSCTSLGREFLIVPNHGWDGKLSSNGSNLELNTAYSYGVGGDNIVIAGLAQNDYLTSAKVVLNTTSKTITVTGTKVEGEAPDPSEITFYMIGDNVNGHSWALAEPDCAFTNMNNGIYRWEGEILGTGFKINDGTWSNGDYNIGAGAGDLILGVPYYYVASGSSGNIAIDGATEVIDPVVILDINEGTITVTGEGAGEASWYIMGLNNNWEFIEAYQLLPVDGKDGVFTQVVEITETVGECKVSDTGWAHERGTNNPDEIMITPTNLSLELEEVFGEAGNINYELEEGSYVVTWDENEFVLTFTPGTGDNGVENVAVEDGVAVYYNLQGQKVANPDNGIFIRVLNGTAAKVVK